MIKKIQRYLLLNHPLIWNLKIVPILLTAIIGNILTFAFGYFSTSINFNQFTYDNDHRFVSTAALYILVILILVIWLVAISKNNALKNYYPSNTKSLYLQWILIGISVFSILVMPFCYDRGTNVKKRSYTTKQDLIKESEIINMSRILLPTTDNYQYFYREVPTEIYQSNIPNPGSLKNPNDYSDYYSQQNNRDSLFFNDNSSTIYYEDFPNFAQYSLLNYEIIDYVYRYLGDSIELLNNNTTYIRNELTVKNWLTEEKADSIKNLMSAFIDIQHKYDVSCNLTADEWFKLMYTPPRFEINKNNLITDHIQKDENVYSSSDYAIKTKYHVTQSRLISNFQEITNAYNSDGFTYILRLFYATLCITMLTFAFRVTSGRDWLIAFVSMGIIYLITAVMTFALGLFIAEFSLSITFALYILLFIVEVVIVSSIRYRGNSGVLVNHIIGLLPLIPLGILYIIIKPLDWDARASITNYIETYFAANLVLTLLTMPLIIKLVMKWKGLPEK